MHKIPVLGHYLKFLVSDLTKIYNYISMDKTPISFDYDISAFLSTQSYAP